MRSPAIRSFVAAFTLALCACEGGSLVETGSGVVDPDAPPSVGLASLTLAAEAGQLSSNASNVADGIVLTATAKDASNNVLSGVSVQFSVDGDGALSPGGLVVTNVDGLAQKTLTTGGNPQNRTLTVTAAAEGFTRTVSIEVVGTTLEVTGADNTQISAPSIYTVNLLDAAGGGIFSKSVTLTTNPGNTLSRSSLLAGDTDTITLTTNASGLATVTLRATVADSFVTATALGLTDTKDVDVSTDEFTFEAPDLGPNDAPPELDINIDQTITVRWFQSLAAVANGTAVDFFTEQGEFTSGGTISAGGSRIRALTSAGLATVTLRSTTSGLSEIRASSTALTKPSARRTVEFVATTPDTITVKANPSVISTSQTSEITATIFDVDGNLVKGKVVEFSRTGDPSGTLSLTAATTNSQGLARVNFNSNTTPSSTDGVTVTARVQEDPTIEDDTQLTVGSGAVGIVIGQGSEIVDKDSSTYQYPFTVVVSNSAGGGVPDADFDLLVHPIRFFKGNFGGLTIECDNEDADLDDRLDVGEDTDGDGILEPGRVVTITPPAKLDADGAGQAVITYPKDRGVFVTVRITGIVNASGTESRTHLDFTLPISDGDVDDLPGISPYGVVADCASPN